MTVGDFWFPKLMFWGFMVLILIPSAPAQTWNSGFRHVTVNDGLIWMATDRGVCSYDGYNFGLTPESAKIGPIWCLIEDSLYRIWLVGMSGKLHFIENGQVWPYKHNDNIKRYDDGFMPYATCWMSSDTFYVHYEQMNKIFKINTWDHSFSIENISAPNTMKWMVLSKGVQQEVVRLRAEEKNIKWRNKVFPLEGPLVQVNKSVQFIQTHNNLGLFRTYRGLIQLDLSTGNSKVLIRGKNVFSIEPHSPS